MSLILDMLGAPAQRPASIDVDHVVRTLARADIVALFPDSTSAAVNILTGAQLALYANSDHDPSWLAGYRVLTRAIVYISAERWPADVRHTIGAVNSLTDRSERRS